VRVLVGHVAPCVPHVGGKYPGGYLFEGLHRLAGRIAFGGLPGHRSGPVQVEAVGVLGAGSVFDGNERGDGQALSPVVRDVEQIQVGLREPVLAGSLYIGLVHASEAVEVVDIASAQVGRYLLVQVL